MNTNTRRELLSADQQTVLDDAGRLRVAAICDVLDELGYRHQAMHHRLRPLLPDIRACGFAGRARTLRWMETDYIVEEDPYGLELDFMDSLRPGDVVVHSSDPGGVNAPWGELMTTIAKRNGAVGCVCDSQIRDAVQIIDMGFPVYYTGIRPLDSKGRARVMAYDVPVRCGDVLVHPHDLVVADFDGVVVVPQAVVAQALALALEKMGKENLARQELLAGKTLREVYDTYRVL
jgi:regulator of RNase E activity RraA